MKLAFLSSHVPLTFSLVLSLTLFGGKLYEILLVDRKWPLNPALIQPKAGGIERNGVVRKLSNIVFEVSFFYSLYVYRNHRDVLMPLTVGASSYVIERSFDLFYFAKKLKEFEKPIDKPVSEIDAKQFTSLNKLRIPLSILTNIGLLEALFTAIKNNCQLK